MSEKTIAFCDFCNNEQSMSPDCAKGYVEYCEEIAISEFDWERTDDGLIKCLNCQDSEVKE